VGNHLLVDLHFDLYHPILLNKGSDKLRFALKFACKEAGATKLKDVYKSFGKKHGYTYNLILAESHASVHTWPEHGVMCLDIFMCGNCDSSEAYKWFLYNLKTTHNLIPKKKIEQKTFRGWI
jgi:S-adenosylmethionine decarboxylase